MLPKLCKADGTPFELPTGVRLVEPGATTPADIKLEPTVYKECEDRGMTLTSWLEEKDPSPRDQDGRVIGLDAFERQLRKAGIVPNTFLSDGIFASTGERFFQAGYPASTILFPEYIDRIARMALIEPASIDAIVGTTRAITQSTYKALSITWEVKDVKKKRVTQGTEFPEVILQWAEEAKSVLKYGRRIKATYEFIREVSLDLLTTAFQLVMTQTRVSEADDAVAIMRNQVVSGYIYNANGASGLDKASPAGNNTLTYDAWLAFSMEFFPYVPDVIIGNKETIRKFVTMRKPGADPMELLAALREGPTTINMRMAQNFWAPVTLVYNGNVPDNELLAIQKRFALERIVQIGTDLVEAQKLITTQFQEIVLSESQNFGVLFPQVIRVLNLN